MLRTIIAAILLSLAAITFVTAPLLMLGCGGNATQQQARAASAVAIVANTGLDVLTKVYETQLVDSIIAAGSASYVDTKARDAAVDAAEQRVIERWRAVWGDIPGAPDGRVGLWTLFRAAHEAWATAIEAGADGASLLTQVEGAYCALVAALPTDAARMIAVPSIACRVVVDAGASDAGIVDGGAAPQTFADGTPIGDSDMLYLNAAQALTSVAADRARSRAATMASRALVMEVAR